MYKLWIKHYHNTEWKVMETGLKEKCELYLKRYYYSGLWDTIEMWKLEKVED